MKGVESAVVHYAPTSIDFLRNLRAQDEEGEGEQYVSAILLEEKSVWDYNQGNPSGDPLTLGDEAPPVSQLTAFYPSDGVLIADHPYVTLQADWVTDDEQEGAELFLRFLLEPVQQERFQSLGYRDHTGAPGPENRRGERPNPSSPGHDHSAGRRHPDEDPQRLASLPQAGAGLAPDGRVGFDEQPGSRNRLDETRTRPDGGPASTAAAGDRR